MKFNIYPQGDIQVIALSGLLVGGTDCDALRAVMRERIAAGHKKFIIDFNELVLANSTGIGILISCYLSMRQDNCSLKFARPGRRVRLYLRVTKLETVFEIYDTLEEAISSYKPDLMVA